MNPSYLEELAKRKEGMIQYLLLKVQEQDWHAVCDASNDIREIEAEKIGYLQAQKENE